MLAGYRRDAIDNEVLRLHTDHGDEAAIPHRSTSLSDSLTKPRIWDMGSERNYDEAEEYRLANGEWKNVETDYGGGVTHYLRNSQGQFNGDSEIYLSDGHPNETTPGKNGLPIPTTLGLKFDHEVLGHGLLNAEGFPQYGEREAIKVENRNRQENMKDERAPE
jgi:hypothetical protein